MSRSVGLAAASELLPPGNGEGAGSEELPPLVAAADRSAGRRGSGRVRHEEKITVYVSAEELLALEQARLNLARSARYGGGPRAASYVRRSLPCLLILRRRGDDSELVRRLSAS